MPLVKALLDDIAKGHAVDEEKIRKVQRNPFKHFGLIDAVGVRPSVLQFILQVDDTFLKETKNSVFRSKDAWKRLGSTWIPASSRSIKAKHEADDHWVSHENLKPLNDVCTRWCTSKYFPDAFSRVNMVANVIRLYDRLRDVTGLKFNIVFKGGVMIRLVLLEFVNNLSLEGRMKATEHLHSHGALSMSDFDFEIVADDNEAPDKFVHCLILLNYAVLLWLQRCMQMEVAQRRPLGLLRLDWDANEGVEDLQRLLQAEVDRLDATSPMHECTIDRVVVGGVDPSPPANYLTKSKRQTAAPRKNVIIFDCEETKCVMAAATAFRELGVHGVPATSGGAMFYATLNTYIGEEERKKKVEGQCRPAFWPGLFHLGRIKHAFVVYYTTKDGRRCCDRLGGEMIDLSQSHNVRMDQLRFHLHRSVPHPYKEYTILGVPSELVTLRSYSVEGFLFDHMTMLHHTEEEPWNVNKMQKRLARYVAFLFAHVFSPDVAGSSTEKITALRTLVDSMGKTPNPLQTGVKPIDEFAARNTLLQGSGRGRAHAYLKTCTSIIGALLRALETSSARQDVLAEETLLNIQKFIFG